MLRNSFCIKNLCFWIFDKCCTVLTNHILMYLFLLLWLYIKTTDQNPDRYMWCIFVIQLYMICKWLLILYRQVCIYIRHVYVSIVCFSILYCYFVHSTFYMWTNVCNSLYICKWVFQYMWYENLHYLRKFFNNFSQAVHEY